MIRNHELYKILKQHAERYPCAAAADYVKLIYQNEFAGGHMIKDEQSAYRFILDEYSSLDKLFYTDTPKFESIGNGLVRANLAKFQKHELQYLCEAFCLTANKHNGDMDSLLRKLELLRQIADAGDIGIKGHDFTEYLDRYIEIGCPAVHHSDVYRLRYKPAYRVIAI